MVFNCFKKTWVSRCHKNIVVPMVKGYSIVKRWFFDKDVMNSCFINGSFPHGFVKKPDGKSVELDKKPRWRGGVPWASLVFLLTLSLPLLPNLSLSWAGQIRSLEINDSRMKPIYLKMGQSTVLRFNERPQKVVIGNQNYFNIEFIGNDVTLQPQELVTTNLFVYGKYHTYGFILKTSHGQRYDDLVKVRWKSETKAMRPHGMNRSQGGGFKSYTSESHSGDFPVSLGPKVRWKWGIEAQMIRVIRLRPGLRSSLYLMDVAINNISNQSIKTLKIQVALTRKKSRFRRFDYVFESDEIPVNGSRRCRVVFHLNQMAPFTLHLKYRGKIKKIIIKRRFLSIR